jgi:hypothetical protein
MSLILIIGLFWIVTIIYLLSTNKPKEAFGISSMLLFVLCVTKISKYYLSISTYKTFINIIIIIMLIPVIFSIFAVAYNKFKKQNIITKIIHK